MSYTIVTDSGCNLPEYLIDEFDLTILPLVFMVDGREYTSYSKGEITDVKKFYTMMREGKVITTSLPNQAHTLDTFKSILSAGNDILYISFSSALSSTLEAIKLLSTSLLEDYPERRILCVDSLAASTGQGILVMGAAKVKQAGGSIDDAAQYVEDNRLHMCHWFTVDDLMYLYRGGRVSRTSAFAANILSIKPILHVDDKGALVPVEKVRGRKKSIKALVDHMEQTVILPLDGKTIHISHADCLTDAEYLRELIEERFGVQHFMINVIDPVIGAHSGPGTLAVFFDGTER